MNEHYANSLQRRLIEAFKSQDHDKGHFDVVFSIEGKKLHANKCVLAAASETFNVQFSQRWNIKNEDVEVTEYSFDVFFTFISFLYSGMCTLNLENVCSMVELGEFYNIPDLVAKCDGYLAYVNCETDEFFHLYERLHVYSLEKFKAKFRQVIFKWYETGLESEEFLNAGPATLKFIVSNKRLFFAEELLFKKVYEWSERRIKNLEESKNNEKIFKIAMKSELDGILPHIHFEEMEQKFIDDFVAEKSFLFTVEQYIEILKNANKFKVILTDLNGKEMWGKIPNIDGILEDIKQASVLQQYNRGGAIFSFYKIIPDYPDPVKKSADVGYYFAIDIEGNYCVIPFESLNKTYYLLAHILSCPGFIFHNCQISIV